MVRLKNVMYQTQNYVVKDKIKPIIVKEIIYETKIIEKVIDEDTKNTVQKLEDWYDFSCSETYLEKNINHWKENK